MNSLVPPVSDSPQLDDITLLASVPGEYAFYLWRNVAINVWMTQPTATIVDRLADLTEQSTRTCPEGISSIHWMTKQSGLPTGPARTALSKISADYDNHISCVAVVIDGSGFWASALRSAINGIVSVTQATFVPRVYGNVDSMVDWLPDAHHRGTDVRVRGSELRAKVLTSVRAADPMFGGLATELP